MAQSMFAMSAKQIPIHIRAQLFPRHGASLGARQTFDEGAFLQRNLSAAPVEDGLVRLA
jgi:hypothetical protein